MGRNCHKSHQPTGFTLVEVLVAITIITALIALVAVGFRAMQNNQRAQTTAVGMSNLKGYLREMQDRKATPPWMPTGVVYLPSGVISEERPIARYGQMAVITQRALRAALQVPSNRQAYNQLPKEKRMDVMRREAGVQYLPGDQVAVDEPAGRKYYVRNSSNAWVVDNTPHTGLLLDGWGNPIFFVPGPAALSAEPTDGEIGNAYGMEGVWLTGKPPRIMRIVNPRSLPWNANVRANYRNIKAYQPFWVSAGADGAFTFIDVTGNGSFDPPQDKPAGDDNIYSFDQQ